MIPSSDQQFAKEASDERIAGDERRGEQRTLVYRNREIFM